MSSTTTREALIRAFESDLAQRAPEDNVDFDVGGFVDDLQARLLATEGDVDLEDFPELYNFSAAFVYRFVPVPKAKPAPEYVYVPSTMRPGADSERLRLSNAVTEWNILWEAGQLRSDMFSDKLPPSLDWLLRDNDSNIFLLPRNPRHRYHAYAPLFHMLPARLLDKHRLPLLRRGIWPHFLEDYWLNVIIPRQFDERLSRAFAELVWGHLNSGSSLSSFSPGEPIRLLAHNLDFWIPYAHAVVERRLAALPRVPCENEEQERLLKEGRADAPLDVEFHRPRCGGVIWQGEEDAERAVDEMIQYADSRGHLRGIIEAIRSNRVEEDFSSRWSYAREDFERKLYRKRSKVSVKFVELDDTIPVVGPESEIHEDMLWQDLIAVLSPKERQVVVLLRSGYTRLASIAEELGYANHSPVSKALARIRRKADALLK
jgi:DNA-binding CsgD family transcriptional regulator